MRKISQGRKFRCRKIVRTILALPMSKNGRLLWREAYLQVKMHKTPQRQTNFCCSNVQKWHAAAARSTFASQNVQNILGPEQLSFFRFPKMARRCGAKHICKSKCTKHHMLGPLFEFQMSKNCTPLWRETHL